MAVRTRDSKRPPESNAAWYQHARYNPRLAREVSLPTKVPLLDLKPQLESLRAEIDRAVMRVVESQPFILGPEVQAFEEELAAFVGTKHAVGCASGTDALILSLAALGVGPGDEVVTTPFSF